MSYIAVRLSKKWFQQTQYNATLLSCHEYQGTHTYSYHTHTSMSATAFVLFLSFACEKAALLAMALGIRAKAKPKAKSHARLSPFLRGVVYGAFLFGALPGDIVQTVTKPDGAAMSEQAARDTIQLVESNGGLKWDGDATALSEAGRPRETTPAFDRKVTKLVFKHRGKMKVTVQLIKKKYPDARRYSDETIRRRLHEAGLKWMRRRRKTLVPAKYKKPRVDWARWVLRRTASTLSRWMYTDGTVFYLAVTQSQQEDKVRAALGGGVWRMANGHDALYEDCVGPSSYAKAQGLPVRVWGLLIGGMLFICVLTEGDCMNRWWYEWIITHHFPRWMKKAWGANHSGGYLVQDGEKALWTPEPRAAMQEVRWCQQPRPRNSCKNLGF